MLRILTPAAGLAAPLLFAALATAQLQQQWLTQLGTDRSDHAWLAAPDGAGGVFIAGHTLGDLAGPNAGYYDIVLARYDASGNQLWITQFGDDDWDKERVMLADGAGGVFIAGGITGDLGGPPVSALDAFIVHYDADGNQTWITRFGSKGDESISGIAPDGAGGFFVGGSTEGDLGGPNAGEFDVFLAHLDADGNQLWVTQFGTAVSDYAYGLVTDGQGGFILVGELWNHSETFLARYQPDGDQLWYYEIGSKTAYDAPNAIVSDGAGGVLVAGETWGDFGGPKMGNGDAFIARFDGTGAQAWAVKIATESQEAAYDLAPDNAGGYFVCGRTFGDLGGPNIGQDDAFIANLTSEGDILSLVQFGSEGEDWPNALAPDGGGGVFVAGFTDGSLGGPNAGQDDAFFGRFVPGCYADLSGDGVLDLFDFLAFVNVFNVGDPAADCTADGVLDLFDFLCFVNAFNQGC